MRFKRQYKLEQGGLESLNMAPLIDVIFQLLIFFMLTSSFSFQSGINVKLPRAITSDVVQTESLSITITSENVMYLNSKLLTVKELRQELTKPQYKDYSILIKADRRASLGRIVDVWDLCREIGIEKINIATNQEE